MFYLHTILHLPSSIGSLAIAINPKTKCRINAVSVLLSCILQENYRTRICVFLKICYKRQIILFFIYVLCRRYGMGLLFVA